MKHTKKILLLLILPSALAELLSGNMPPLRYFQPIVLAFFVLLYGCGALLIREARSRWGMGWSVAFLAVAYGIAEEGLTTKAIFNTSWPGAAPLGGYGMFAGVQWVWTLGVVFAHAAISVLIPIAIVDYLWPEDRDKAWLGRVGIGLSTIGFAGAVLLGLMSFGTPEGGITVPFHPEPACIFGALAAVLALSVLAVRFRGHRFAPREGWLAPPLIFGLTGFSAPAFFLIVPAATYRSGAPGSAAVIAEIAYVAFALLFCLYQLGHRLASVRHMTALVAGSLAPYVLLAPVQEFVRTNAANPKTGLTLVGLLAAVGLAYWSGRAIRQAAPTP